MVKSSRRAPRSGASAVEFAFIAIIYLMFIMGILEYARYLFVLQLTNNAAREGARFAVTNTNSVNTSTGNPYQLSDIQAYVDQRMAGMGTQCIQGYTPTGTNDVASIKCYACDPFSGNPCTSNTFPYTTTPPPGDSTTQVNVTQSSSFPATSTWTNAAYGIPIAVEVYGTYKPITPAMLLMPSTITVNAKAVMYSEAN